MANMENEKIVIGNRSSGDIDPIEAINSFYSKLYLRDKEDSPTQSRLSLARKSRSIISGLGSRDYVLDLGAGRQIFEREYEGYYPQPACKIVTVDIAQIRRRQLLARFGDISHVRASGNQLPFNDGTFSLVVSNMALDFMPENTIDELHRVMRRGSVGLVNLHHPYLIPKDLDTKLKRGNLTERQKRVYEFWKYLRENNVLYSDEFEILNKFFLHGFDVKGIDRVVKRNDTWWEVEVIKPFKLSRYDVFDAANKVIQLTHTSSI